MTAAITMAVVTLVMQAAWSPNREAQNKEERLVKLTSDINKVDQAIQVTKVLIRKTPDANFLPDMYLRLAELYVEKSRYVFARLAEQQPENEKTLEGDKSVEVQLNKKLAVEIYTKILRDYPDYKNNDQVRFFKAHEFRELGEWDTMVKEYKELAEKFPKSDWANEARLILGDYHFDKGELPAGEDFYKGILSQPESYLHDMARYKLGWIRINQEKFKDALVYFEQAIKSPAHTRRGAVGDARSLNVKREALSALVWPFSEVRKAKEAPKYLRKLAQSKREYIEAMEKLANRYFVKSKYADAAALYRYTVKMSANVEVNVENVQRIYESVRNLPKSNPKRYAHASSDVDAIVRTLAQFQNSLEFAEKEKGQLSKDFELRARDLATRLHVEAQSNKDERSARIAAEAYRKYLGLFTAVKERKTMQMNRAEALFQSKDYVRAGLQYEDIPRDEPKEINNKDLMYSALVSYQKALEDDSKYREKHANKEGLLSRLDLLRAREGLKQLGAHYVKTWPQSDKIPDVKFNIAKMYYQQGDYERAANLFRLFVQQYPAYKDVAIAGNLALDSLNKLDQYEELAKLVQEFLANKAITDTKFRDEIAKLGDAAKQRKIDFAIVSSSGQGDFSEKMLSEWEKNKGSKEGEEFLYAAFVKYRGEGNVNGVFDFGNRLVGAYPQSKRVAEVINTMGNFAFRIADFERAAFLFEEFHKRYPQDKSAVELLMSAATVRYFLGDLAKAAQDFEVLARVGTAAQKRRVYEKLLEIYRDGQDWPTLARVSEQAMREAGNWVAAVAYAGLAASRQGQEGRARELLSQAARMSAGNEFDQEAKARATFELGAALLRVYDSVAFRDEGSAAQVLGQKLQLLQTLEKTFVAAVNSGSAPWAIAALYESSRAYHAFGTFIQNAPAPAMGAEELREYRAALAGQARTYEAKGRDTLKACSRKAEELHVFNAYAAGCMRGETGPVNEEAKHIRRQGGDFSNDSDVVALRQKLLKNPRDVASFVAIARKALAQGDYHFAKLTASKALEVDNNNGEVQNLLGVAEWTLGNVQEAYDAFEKAYKGRSPAAALNLGGLSHAYGYDQAARRYLKSAGNTATDSPDVHPKATQALEEVGR